MIPYFHFDVISIGPLNIHVWGLMVSLGMVAGILFAYRLAKKFLLSGEVVLDMAVWGIVGALIFARAFHVVFYDPFYYTLYPGEILKFWNGGASSFGGFFGAGFGIWLFCKKRKFSWKEILPYFDMSAVGLWLGWGIGRIGCFLTHQHPGKLTNFFFAVNYDGGARFDLGILESLLGFSLFIMYLLLFKKLVKVRWWLVAAISIADYAIFRFFLDFLRATPDFPGGDVRYLSFTPAQWGAAALLVGL
ncbi:MAG: prolipoprotein diacylglyceryl transferase family protein, partial [Patescibacteria group bacterium]